MTYADRVQELEAEGMTTSDAQGVADAEGLEPIAVIDPDAPCGWCGTTDRPRIQRGPSLLGYQCADADACKADNRIRTERRAGATDAFVAKMHRLWHSVRSLPVCASLSCEHPWAPR